MDIDKRVHDYEREYSEYVAVLPTDGEPLTPMDLEKSLIELVESNRTLTACASCPLHGNCKRINWKADLDLVRVIGCSMHPDQTEFRGHSTTVVITSSNAGRNYTNVNTTWATNYDLANAQNQSTAAGSCGVSVDTVNGYTFYRPWHVFSMAAIPSGASSLSATFQVYLGAHTDGTGTYKLCDGHVSRPTGDVSDYNRTYYTLCGTSTWNRSNFTINSYNDITITDLTTLHPGGSARYIGRSSEDYDNSSPGLVPPPNLFFTGVTTGNMPKLQYTYELGRLRNNSMAVRAGRWI